MTRLLCMSWRFSMLNLADTRPGCVFFVFFFHDLNDSKTPSMYVWDEFTYIKTIKINHSCRQICQSHGWYGISRWTCDMLALEESDDWLQQLGFEWKQLGEIVAGVSLVSVDG